MIRIESLSKQFTEIVLLDNITYHFSEGEKIALVGPNGAGKTTLLNILSGIEPCDSGKIIRPQGLRMGYLPQEPNAYPKKNVVLEAMTGEERLSALSDEMNKRLHAYENDPDEEHLTAYEKAQSDFRLQGGYSLESRTIEILRGLGFRDNVLGQNPLHLSGGWRMRLELARIFVKNPDFLILDEPTNHLDLPSLVWVEKYLRNFQGTLLFVSHDRQLLNRLASHILHLSRGKLQSYKGNFDDFLAYRSQRREEEEARKEQIHKKIEHMERFVERFGAKATKAKQAQSRVKMISKLKSLEDGLDIDEDAGAIHFALKEPPKSGRVVMEARDLSIGYNGVPLSEGMNFIIERGQCVAIIGANGIGKTTLLKTIHGIIPSVKGMANLGYEVKTAYFAQNQLDELSGDRSVLETLLDASSDLGEREARNLLGSFLFRGEDVCKSIKVLSGGEKGRVALARLLSMEANFIILDEPTNHLDMSSVEVLISALGEFQGTILFVSHNRDFINAIATHVYVMLPDGRAMLFEGKLDDYESAAALRGFPNVFACGPEREPASAVGNKPVDMEEISSMTDSGGGEDAIKDLRREKNRLEKENAKLEDDQTSLRERIDQIRDELSEIDVTDYKKLSNLNVELKDCQERLHSTEEAWIENSERLEAIRDELSSLGRK